MMMLLFLLLSGDIFYLTRKEVWRYLIFSKLLFNFNSLSLRNFSFASCTATSLMELISICWLTIDLVSSAVMVLEAPYFSSDMMTGFLIANPPYQHGRAKMRLSVSEICLPIRAGMNLFLMALSSGLNNSDMLGTVL